MDGDLNCSNKSITVDNSSHDKTVCDEHDCTYNCPSLSLALQYLNYSSHIVINIINEEIVLNILQSSSDNVLINSTHNLIIRGSIPFSIVTCVNRSSISCVNCSNVVIQNIHWVGCGKSIPEHLMPAGVFFRESSNITIQNCAFRKSSVHALALATQTTVNIVSSSFIDNQGSALYALDSNFNLSGEIEFRNNQGVSGAAIFSDGSYTNWLNASINFTNNSVNTYGGAVYAGVTATCYDPRPFAFIQNLFNSNVTFNNNYAGITGNSWYFETDVNCDKDCQVTSLFKYVENFTYLPSNDFRKEIGTTVFYLNLFEPAVCHNKSCTISKKDFMLGEEIIVPTNATGYYNETISEVSRFLISCVDNCDDYSIGGSDVVLVQQNMLRGFHIKGKRVKDNKHNQTSVTLQIVTVGNDALASNRVMARVKLTVTLSPCKPGFEYDDKKTICKCYNQIKVVKCSDEATASIKQGFWFGTVNRQATTTFCPNQYCDFTSCDDCISFCNMPKSSDGQCREHRTGIACGNCKLGYVLPFDSIVCVDSDECFSAMTVLIIILLVLYWLATVALIMIFMNFSFPIGYTYGIIYFYSIVDLLYYNLANSEILFIKIMSGFARLTPKFLGTLCLTNDENWSGIDQQFFHYVHPIAVSLILLTLTIAARYSVKLSHYISRSIVRAICLILLLAYTSVASTSLKLLQPLFFNDIDEAYTYSSPDNRYFHGRHAFYGVVALVLGVVVVIGFPLALLLEPFVSSKIYFARLKPILDQFQGCYKDKCRHFAGYYLLCRLFIMIVVFTSRSYYVTLFIIRLVCIIIAMIHGWVLPYRSKLLNGLDLVILLTAVFVIGHNTSYLPDSFDGVVYIGLVIFPLICFIGFGLASPILKTVMAIKQKKSSMVALEYESLLESRSAINDDFLDSRDDSTGV